MIPTISMPAATIGYSQFILIKCFIYSFDYIKCKSKFVTNILTKFSGSDFGARVQNITLEEQRMIRLDYQSRRMI